MSPVQGWDAGQQLAEESSTSIFLKLEDDGDKALGCFVGDPLCQQVFFSKKDNRYIDADSEDGEKYAAKNKGKRPSFRFRINMLVLGLGDEDTEFDLESIDLENARVMIYEQGVKVWRKLCKAKNKYGLGKKVFELERNGKAGSTNTEYSLMPEGNVKDVDGLAELIASIDLHDLTGQAVEEDDDDSDEVTSTKSSTKKKTAKKTASAKKSAKNGKSNGANGITIDQIRTSLKALPDGHAKAGEFLEAFELRKVKELPEAKFGAAMEWIAAQAAEAEEEAGDSDPFD